MKKTWFDTEDENGITGNQKIKVLEEFFCNKEALSGLIDLLEKKKDTIEQSFEKISQIESDLEKFNQEINQYKNEVKSLQDTWQSEFEQQEEARSSNFNQLYKKCEQYAESITTRNKNIQTKCEEILSNSAAAGLARAYEERKNELREGIKQNKIIFLLANSLILAGGLCLFKVTVSLLSGEDFNYLSLIPRYLASIPIFFPLIWIAKHSGEVFRRDINLLEEYSHKKAITSTYEGYSGNLQDKLNERSEILEEAGISFSGDEYYKKLQGSIENLIALTTQGIMRNPVEHMQFHKEELPLEDLIKQILSVVDKTMSQKEILTLLMGALLNRPVEKNSK